LEPFSCPALVRASRCDPSPAPVGGSGPGTRPPDSGAHWSNGPLRSAFAQHRRTDVEIEGAAQAQAIDDNVGQLVGDGRSLSKVLCGCLRLLRGEPLPAFYKLGGFNGNEPRQILRPVKRLPVSYIAYKKRLSLISSDRIATSQAKGNRIVGRLTARRPTACRSRS
jgi:hypothetical protein